MTSAKISWWLRAGLAAVICLFVVKYGLIPFCRWQDETVQKIGRLQGVVARKEALIGGEDEINAQLRRAVLDLEAVEKLYYRNFTDTQALQLWLQKEIERLAAASGVKIKSSDWLYPSEGYIVQVPIKLRCEAEPFQLITFIYAIENSERFFTIDKLMITARDRSATLIVEGDLSAYGIREQGFHRD